MLHNMRNKITAMKSQWKYLAPTELKELQSRLNEIDQQLAKRNPFKALISSMKEYIALGGNQARAFADERAMDTRERAEYEMDILLAKKKIYEAARAQHGEENAITIQAKQEYESQKGIADKAQETANAAEQAATNFGRVADNVADAAEAMMDFASYADQAIEGTKELVSTFSSTKTSETFDIIASGASKAISGIANVAKGVALVSTGDLAGIANVLIGIKDVIVGIFNAKNELHIKRMDEEIERQGELIENLERSYDRLGEALEKSFGNDYVYNFSEQLKILEAEAEAYRAQAEAERNKGKKADEKAAADYDKAAEDAIHKIEEIQDAARSAFAGSDLASAAESFADAWLSAYEEFGDTAGALEERMTDMVKNIMKKAALSGIAQAVMGDWYKSLSEVQDWNAATIAEKWQQAMALVGPMVDGMQVFANSMAAEGMSLRNLSGQFTGIKRDIANASEESITGLAAGINTQNFYMSTISENVSLILRAMTGGTSSATGGQASEYGDPYKDKMAQYVSSLPQMRDDMAAIRAMLDKVIRPNGTPATYYVAAKM